MAIFDVSGRTTLVTATAMAPLAAIRGAQTGRPTKVREIHLFAVTAPTTVGELGLCLSTALGTGSLTSVAPVTRDSTRIPTAGAVLVTAWATLAPTVGAAATAFRRAAFGPAIGNGIIWTFDGESFEIPVGGATSELVLVNLQALAPGTWAFSAVLEE